MPENEKISTHTPSAIRAVNPGRDMPMILDLIEIGFQDELDPQGWKMLKQMRRIYQPGLLTHLFHPPLNTTGFVWVEEGQVVGNLSLRRAMPQSARGRMIGNVVVHPAYRGRGIGRALMQEAINLTQESHATWVGLEVRADNAIACQLYRDLGFQPVGHVQHMLRPGGRGWPDFQSPHHIWTTAKPDDSDRWVRLAHQIYGYHQRRVLEIRKGSYRYGGFDRWLEGWLGLRREKAWISQDQDKTLRLATHVETDYRAHFHVWDLLMAPSAGRAAAQEVVAKSLAAVRRLPAWPVIAVVPDLVPLVAAMREAGFVIHRTLQQMILEF
jgi:ribosomal protein S18 acetylase RimI-like enzyme